jgi:uncharacterized protein YkwD
MCRLTFSLILFCTVVLALSAQEKKEEQKNDDKKDQLKITKEEQAIIDLTNAERKKGDAMSLTPNAQLMTAARLHAANMAKQDKLEHVLDEMDVADRVKEAGYLFVTTGENIAWNQATPKEAVKAWMDSPGHKENMMNPDFTEIGVAVMKNKKGQRYWVQVFGAPRKK